jgi:hypothetical protein
MFSLLLKPLKSYPVTSWFLVGAGFYGWKAGAVVTLHKKLFAHDIAARHQEL